MTSSGTEKEGHVESKNTYKPHHSFTVLNDSDSGKVYSQPETPVHELEAFPQVDASQEDEAPPEQLEAKHKVLIVLSLCICVFLSALDQTIITTAIPVIAGQFQSPSAYTWIGSSYLLASAAFLPSWGKFSDIWGRKPVLLAAAVLFIIGSVFCAAAKEIGLMLAGRVIQGIGAGGQLGLVNVTLSDIVAVRDRGLYLSFVGMTWAFAAAIGPVLGGVFTEMAPWGWRFCFILNIPIGIFTLIMLYLFLNLKSPSITLMEGLIRVDWIGTALLVAGVILFLIGLEFGGITEPWTSATVLCLLIFGILLMAGFLFYEWKVAKEPIMPMSLFAGRTKASCYLVGFFHGFVFIGCCYFLPLYFQAVRGYTPLMSGVYVLPYVIFLSGISGATGALIARTGLYQQAIWAGGALMTLGTGLLIMLNRTSTWAEIVIFQILAGAGAGPLFQGPLIALHSVIDPADIATATTTFAFVRTLGMALAISLGLVVFQNSMAKQAGPELREKLGGELADRITGGSASASIELIRTLEGGLKTAAQDVYAKGMRHMWWFFFAIAAAGFVATLGIGKHHLSKKLESSQPAVKRPKKGHRTGAETEAETEKTETV